VSREHQKNGEGIGQRRDATRALSDPVTQVSTTARSVPFSSETPNAELLAELAKELRKTRQKLWKLQTDPRSTERFSSAVEHIAEWLMIQAHDAEDLANLFALVGKSL
jgi:hypothetical protein